MPAFAVIMSFIKEYWMYILGAIGAIILYRKLLLGNKLEKAVNYSEQGATITDAQAQGMANTLYQSMKEFGTKEAEIENIRKQLVSNTYNLAKVWNKFGVKDYGVFGSPSIWGTGTPTNLLGWLEAELSTSDFNKWKQMFNTAGIY